MEGERVSVDVIIYKIPDMSPRHGFWNCAAAFVARMQTGKSKGYATHVELGWPVDAGAEEATSVWMGGEVFFRERTYQNRKSPAHGHQHYTISVPVSRVGAGVRFAQAQVGKKFNLRGMVSSVTPWATRSTGRKWYCAELVTAVLGHMGVSTPFPSHRSTPALLEDWASRVGAVSLNPMHARCERM